MATSSIQAFNGGALNGGFRPEDLQPLRVLTPMQSEPAAEYTPEYGADWVQRAVVFKKPDNTVVATYRPFKDSDTTITIPDLAEIFEVTDSGGSAVFPTYAQITAALADGKIPVLKRTNLDNGNTFFYICSLIDETNHAVWFRGLEDNNLLVVDSADGWAEHGDTAKAGSVALDYGDLTFPVGEKTYCMHDGYLYYCSVPGGIATSEPWTPAHWTGANVTSIISGIVNILATWLVQSDWSQSDSTAADYIKNKPTIPAAQVQSDWNQSDNTQVDYIKNKPTIPAAQIQSDWSQADNTQVDYIKNKPAIPAVVVMTALWDSGAGDYRYPAISDIYDAWNNNKDVILVRYTPANSRNYWRLVSTASNNYKFADINPDNAHQSILVAQKVGGTDTWTETKAGQWGHWVNTGTWRTMLSLSVEMHLETAPTLDDGSGFYQETDLEDEVFEAGVYHFDMEISFNRQLSSLTVPVMYDMTVKVGTSTVFATSMTFQGRYGGANGINETAQISGIIKVPSSGKINVNLIWSGGDNTLDNDSRLKMSHLFLRKLYI